MTSFSLRASKLHRFHLDVRDGRRGLMTFIFAIALAIGTAIPGWGQTDQETKAEAEPAVVEYDFASFISDQDLDRAAERAWEYRPYRVAVWVCHDGSPKIGSQFKHLVDEISQRSELVDPSGWDLAVGPPPPQWRWRFLESIQTHEKCSGFEDLKDLKTYDKLMIVCLSSDSGQIHLRVREFDLQTQQWGPLVDRHFGHTHQLGAAVVDAIQVAFMPLSRVDRIIEANNKDEVILQARAINSCIRTKRDESLEWVTVPIEGSPVFIRDDDFLLPVIRRTDRKGELLNLEPLDFTFLTVDGRSESELNCSIQSYHRAPLAGRKSKRAEKLALVIRPPEEPTTLKLVARNDNELPLEGIEIWSRRAGADISEPSELLGKTDWQGALDIPPSEDGLRLIYLKRGSRPLKKLPMIPGLYQELTTTVPNDETSLYAEGIIMGLEREILNLVVQRNVFESDIAAALEKKDLDSAKGLLRSYQELESPRDIKTRMADEEVRLKSMTRDKRQLEFISRRFNSLRVILSSEGIKSRETKLQEEIQKQSNLPPT